MAQVTTFSSGKTAILPSTRSHIPIATVLPLNVDTSTNIHHYYFKNSFRRRDTQQDATDLQEAHDTIDRLLQRSRELAREVKYYKRQFEYYKGRCEETFESWGLALEIAALKMDEEDEAEEREGRNGVGCEVDEEDEEERMAEEADRQRRCQKVEEWLGSPDWWTDACKSEKDKVAGYMPVERREGYEDSERRGKGKGKARA